MTIASDKVAKFAQTARRAAIETLFEQPWITLYRCDEHEAWFSGLLAPEKVPEALKSMSWDLHWGNMRPSVVTYGMGEDAETEYERFCDEGVEPIVIARERGCGPFFIELAEDIRLYLNLFPGENGALVQHDSAGHAETVAIVEAREVRIRKGPLLRYLAARQMYLAVFFDHIVTLEGEADNPLPEADRYVDVREPDRTWSFGSIDETGDPLSRLCGKRLLAPPSRTEANTDYDEVDRHAAFIIGEDVAGRPVEHSADPSGLANLFGANAGAPDYLTPVHFRREVLDRYFHNPGRYEVGDGVVRCDPHWVLRMDDDHRERVLVFLGDLGRDLPYAEQLHWRAHNILPDGGLSSTAWTRSFDSQPADGEQPEHRFKIAYQRFNDRWLEAHGWHLFRPLALGDRHLLTKLHVPISDNPAELDAQLLGLAKILVDSLNDEALGAALGNVKPGERSLAKLQRFLEAHLGAPGYLMTATELARAAGWTDYSAANLHYGNLGYELSRELGWTPPKREDGTPVWTMVLAVEPNGPDVAGKLIETTDFQWKLRPQVIDALNMYFGK